MAFSVFVVCPKKSVCGGDTKTDDMASKYKNWDIHE